MFFIVRLIPGTPAAAMLGPDASPEQIKELTHSMGLDGPLITQYISWILDVVRGDFGKSMTFGQPVIEVIANHALPTIALAVSSTVLSFALSIPLAVKAAANPRSFWARALTPLTAFGLAIPPFWLSLVLVLIFGVLLKALPVSGYVDLLSSPVGGIKYLILPIVALAAPQVALFVATLRESVSSELLSLYVRSARSKGVSENKILYRHVLRNSLLPAITVVSASFGYLLGGVIVIEMIFVVPGWGLTLYNGILARDYPLILGLTFVMAITFVIVNAVADILYMVADPKVRVQ